MIGQSVRFRKSSKKRGRGSAINTWLLQQCDTILANQPATSLPKPGTSHLYNKGAQPPRREKDSERDSFLTF